jgi:hypothetical protein
MAMFPPTARNAQHYQGSPHCRATPARSGTLKHYRRAIARCVPGILGTPHLTETDGKLKLDYCTGQYFPTEYRKAVAAVLAQALWDHKRDHCMPPEERQRKDSEGTRYLSNGKWLSAGEYIRTSFRKQFGRTIADRFFQ